MTEPNAKQVQKVTSESLRIAFVDQGYDGESAARQAKAPGLDAGRASLYFLCLPDVAGRYQGPGSTRLIKQ
ncbi:hypothetical protein [Azotobacter salinestris]|uniref:hypothetical protein n=1 Tax=Azotobacter salinestris TaxID=69964 RepID=UPI003CC72D59